jgi:hypothetical protein
MNLGWWTPFLLGEVTEEDKRQRAVRYADNLKKCSCWRCRNARELEGPPVRELRWMTCEEIDE